jgi:excisionase family DNA binding protein
MAKMFYNAKEAAAKLGISEDTLKQLVTDNKLREFRDGPNVMFKVDQVEKIASSKSGSSGGSSMSGSAIGLAGSTSGGMGLSDSSIPLAESGKSDAISLADSDIKPAAKEDTVVTGQNMFDTAEVKPADSQAQTQIQSAIDDQLSLEGVGSGSGLLDLTRESDDTSLGAELLDEIYPGGDSKAGTAAVGSSTGIFEAPPTASMETAGTSGLDTMTGQPMAPLGVAEVVEAPDPSSGAFGGMALAAVLAMFFTVAILLFILRGYSPSWLESITQSFTSLMIFAGVLVIVSALFALVGYLTGKATAR